MIAPQPMISNTKSVLHSKSLSVVLFFLFMRFHRATKGTMHNIAMMTNFQKLGMNSALIVNSPKIMNRNAGCLMMLFIDIVVLFFSIYSLFLVSIHIVTGPSFSSSTFMSAPNSPVATCLPIASESCVQKAS